MYFIDDVNSPEEAEDMALNFAADELRDVEELQATDVFPVEE